MSLCVAGVASVSSEWSGIFATKKSGSAWSMSEPSVGGGRCVDSAVDVDDGAGFRAKEGMVRISYWIGDGVRWKSLV